MRTLPRFTLQAIPEQESSVAMSTTRKGGLRELQLCAYFIEKGYEVFHNVVPDGLVDIVVFKRETMEVHYVDSKSPVISVKDGSLNNKLGILSDEQKQKGVKAVIFYEGKAFYIDADTPELKEFV